MSDSEIEEEYEVESIVEKRLKRNKVEYLIKWIGWPHDTNTWEPLAHLSCDEIIREYEELNKGKDALHQGKDVDVSKKEKEKEIKKPEFKSKYKGFDRGLTVEKIIGVTRDPKDPKDPKNSGELHFLIKWRGSHEADLVPAREANVKVPQDVIKFYQRSLNWSEDDDLVKDQIDEQLVELEPQNDELTVDDEVDLELQNNGQLVGLDPQNSENTLGDDVDFELIDDELNELQNSQHIVGAQRQVSEIHEQKLQIIEKQAQDGAESMSEWFHSDHSYTEAN